MASEPIPEPTNLFTPPSEDYDEIVWDGQLHSYRPTADWMSRVSPKLELYADTDDDLDPVTFEVLRNRLWTINIAHGETLIRISGSPIFQALDFNMAILAEDGEIAMNAPYLQYLNGGSRLVVQYLMEHFSEDPGIHEGDIFLASDPWIGASHQMDVLMAAPIFVEGKLFGWVSNAAHQIDMGGIVPGGWPQNAVDVYSDPVFFTPFKIVEGGTMRKDLERMYRRHSRMPDLLALDLRAQLSGCRFAVGRIQETCEEFGAPAVKTALRRVINAAQKAVSKKLSLAPDGAWKEVRYLDENLPGDRTTHRTEFTIEKCGDRLMATNTGTDPQGEGPLGFTYMNFSGGLLAVLSVTMLYEQTFSVGGAERQVDFMPLPGTLTCADHPAAVSGGVLNVVTFIHGVFNAVSRMLATAPELRDDIMTSGPEFPLLVMAGTNAKGEFFGTGMMDVVGLGGGARSHSDGVDTGGPAFSPLMRVPNVEDSEQFYPLLLLFRREREDSGGAGRWRGGVGLEYALTPYQAGSIEAITNCGGMGVSAYSAGGLFGGYPSPASRYDVLKGSNLEELFKNGRMPLSLDEITAATHLRLRAKSNGTPLQDGDVVFNCVTGSGGYGDPIQREPERVARDVALGYVSSQAAEQVYGVIVDRDGKADVPASDALRQQIRKDRSNWPVASSDALAAEAPTPATGEPPRSVHEYVEARDEGAVRVLACSACGHVHGDYRSNYKLKLLRHEGPVSNIPRNADPKQFLDEEIVFRRYCCPGCQVLVSTEVVRANEVIIDEMRFV